MEMKAIIWTVVAMLIALALWYMFVSKALKISAYEQAYERI